ncbi:hypothetical protein [Siminovitchia terrae]|uniref:hypothetical protein n=1 Tax=Siminovitchia terrae TaxID=1914933 RepID=UPI001BB3B442|nr:hypothetical protein [Siminovitchia terrae]
MSLPSSPCFLYLVGVTPVSTSMNRRLRFCSFIQQKSPTSVCGEMNGYWYSIQWGLKPRLNKVKASGGHRFFRGIYRAELDKIWAQIRQGAFDFLMDFDDATSSFDSIRYAA